MNDFLIGSREQRRALAGMATIWALLMAIFGCGVWLVLDGNDLLESFQDRVGVRGYTLESNTSAAKLNRDGSLSINEAHVWDYDGRFSGAYRDILHHPDETIRDVAVKDDTGANYLPGGRTELGSYDLPGTFGVVAIPGGTRVVWHHSSDGERTFNLAFTGTGAPQLYNDVAVVNWQVWGDQWDRRLGTLNATMKVPKAAVGSDLLQAWAHADGVETDVSVDGRNVSLSADNIPAGTPVELVVMMPRAALVDKAQGEDLGGTRAELERDRQQTIVNDEAQRLDELRWLRSPGAWIAAVVLALMPAAVYVLLVYLLVGRERSASIAPTSMIDPPSDLQPALAQALTDQETGADRNAFTATIFDLVRRGRYKTLPATSAGGKTVDLAISPDNVDMELEDYEDSVAKLLDRVTKDEPVALGDLNKKLKKKAKQGAKDYGRFQKRVKEDIADRAWYQRIGGRWLIIVPAVLVSLLAAFIVLGFFVSGPVDGILTKYWLAWFGFVLTGNALLLWLSSRYRSLAVRRRPDVADEAARWDAFRSYLDQYAHLEDDHPASLDLWEAYLIYGIAFGCAERIIDEVTPHLPDPDETGDWSTWATFHMVSHHGINYSDFSGAVTSGSTYASSGSGGSAGGFSGGSFSGGGSFGGGGGSW